MPKYKLDNIYKSEQAKVYFNKLLEKKAYIELKEIKLKRSIDQNSLYWIWLTCIEKETGNAKEQFHLLYRANFLAKEDEYITKIIIPSLWERLKIKINSFDYFKGLEDIIDVISRSTTALDTAEFTIYLEKIKDHANDAMGILLLTLEEKGFLDFINEYR